MIVKEEEEASEEPVPVKKEEEEEEEKMDVGTKDVKEEAASPMKSGQFCVVVCHFKYVYNT